MLLWDEYKGFILDKSVINEKQSGKITTGIDSLPDYSLLGQWAEGQLEKEIDKADLGPKSKERKKLEKQQKKLRVSQRRLNKLRGVEPSDEINYAKIKMDIMALYKKYHTVKETKLYQYESVALYSTDLTQVLPGEWINDNIISLIYEFLINNYLKAHKKFVTLLSPALVQLVVYSDFDDLINPDDFVGAKFIFVPLNETQDGDHWFLSVVNIIESHIYIYDSMGDGDDDIINNLINKLIRFKIINKKLKVVKIPIEQQPNFDDCGVYVIMISCFLVNMLLNEQINFDLSSIKFNPFKARLDILKVIDHIHNSIDQVD